MNTLNLLSARVIGQTSIPRHTKGRSRSLSESTTNKAAADAQPLRRSVSQHAGKTSTVDEKELWSSDDEAQKSRDSRAISDEVNEKTPLLEDSKIVVQNNGKPSKIRIVARRLIDALTASIKWVLYTLAAPGIYVVTGFYNDDGQFSPLTAVRRLGRLLPKRNGRHSTAHAVGLFASPDTTTTSSITNHHGSRKSTANSNRRKPDSADSISSATMSETDTDDPRNEKPAKTVTISRPKPQPSSSSEEVPRRSIRIKLYNDDTGRRRKTKKTTKTPTSGVDISNSENHPPVTAANIKSPTSPVSSLRMTKYPRAPAPPRPLVPRRQPSYSLSTNPSDSIFTHKTLVIDLDETLIHSLAKGGRMSSGHMVEVKLSTAVGFGGTTLGPQHPILYYVHKRPHCDDFLRKVCKWYNLVVFTASVQEYADPVIDWLEQERKYFSARYYRQHCTFRNGAYIKDLSSVEPDLSKVMILDNSPLSYIFHEGMK